MLFLSRYISISDPFFELDSQQEKQIIFSGISGEGRIIHPQIVDLIKSGNYQEIPEPLLKELKEISIVTDQNISENGQILKENRQASEEEDVLYHVIQPSAWCQLDCGYCGQTHERKIIKNGIQEKVFERITKKLQHKSYRNMHIGWFGGEPLSGLTALRAMSKGLMWIAEKHGIGYSAKIVTNGLALTPKIFQELSQRYGIKQFEITLDGTEQVHNKRRPMKTGAGSFEQILGNLEKIIPLKADEKITIRVNVDQENYKDIPELINIMQEKNLHLGVGVYFAPIHDWGNDAGEDSMSMQDFSQHELVWYAQMMEKGFSIGLIPNRKKVACLSLSPTSEVFDAYGDVYDCSEMSQVTSYGSPNRYRVDNLNLVATDRNQRLFSDFNDRIEKGETTCKDCYCLPLCGGACPKSWEDGHIPCPSFKYNLSQRLLLQYANNRINN